MLLIENKKPANIGDLKMQQQRKYDQLLTECSVFFAFSNKQFIENKTPLQEGEKYVSIGNGGYMPKSKWPAFQAGSKAITKWFKDATHNCAVRRANIAYELNNHEAYYTGDIEDTLIALGEGYTAAEVRQVYNDTKES